MSLPIAILAGGLATRMLPITEKTPKSLIPVANDFFICHQLRYLKQQGLDKIVLCVGHLGEQIEKVVGNGADFDLDVIYSWDGSKRLGTGGALRQALPLLGEAFFILYGDTFLPIDFRAVENYFHKMPYSALLTLLQNKNKWDKSNVLFKENLILEYNKKHTNPAMEYIDYGLAILEASVLASYPEDTSFDLGEVYYELSQCNALLGYEVFQRFYEIGSKSGLAELNHLLNSQKFLHD